MKELEGHSAVSLLFSCEHDYCWAVRHEDFALPDPPVYRYRKTGDDLPFVPDKPSTTIDHLTSFVLEYALRYTRREGGGFGTEVADAARLIRDLEARFPIRYRVGEMRLFEEDDLLVHMSIRLSRSLRNWVKVEVARPLPREAIPPFIWEYTCNGGLFHGMFIPDQDRAGPENPPV